MTFLKDMLFFIFPRKCEMCEKISKSYICDKCKRKIEGSKLYLNKVDDYSKDNTKFFDEHAYIFEYNSIIREKIIEYKFKNKPYLGKMFSEFIVKNGRHPVLEKILPLGTYVANDLDLQNSTENDSTRFMILTGPNMAGKSTYMRQNALIAILAQIGSYVPADYARIGIADKIFTRVGASDDLTLGQSTFMVEMVETAYILNNATENSFILIDEIGRGTSTYDGVAIAWAVAEHIATKINARCIFATHYHELNVMTKTYPQIKNYRITITEEDGKIEFLRKIVPGGASKSYGIHVAKMAGLPESVISKSQALMNRMQKDYSKNLSTKKYADKPELVSPQLNLFNK